MVFAYLAKIAFAPVDYHQTKTVWPQKAASQVFIHFKMRRSLQIYVWDAVFLVASKAFGVYIYFPARAASVLAGPGAAFEIFVVVWNDSHCANLLAC